MKAFDFHRTHPRLYRAWNFTGWVCAVVVWLTFVEVLCRFTVGSLAVRVESLPAFFSGECRASLVGLARLERPDGPWADDVRPWRFLEYHSAIFVSSDADECAFRTEYIRRAGKLVFDGGPVVRRFVKRTGEPLWPRPKAPGGPWSIMPWTDAVTAIEPGPDPRPLDGRTLATPDPWPGGPRLLQGRLSLGQCERFDGAPLSCLDRTERR